MKLLALDIATTIGIAVGEVGGSPKAWSETIGKKSDDDDLLFSRALSLTSRLISQHEPDLIAYEGAVGGDRTSHYLVGIIANVRGCARNRGIETISCNIGAIRKHFIGRHITSADYPHLPKSRRKAQARKDAKLEVQKRCKLLGYGDLAEDPADACAVWDYAAATRGRQAMPGGGLFANG
jgi:hypothetical protein